MADPPAARGGKVLNKSNHAHQGQHEEKRGASLVPVREPGGEAGAWGLDVPGVHGEGPGDLRDGSDSGHLWLLGAAATLPGEPMNISLTNLTLTAPLAGKPPRKVQRSHTWEYRKKYQAMVRAREFKHGKSAAKTAGSLLKTIQVLSQADVAELFGISKQAVAQIENRAIGKVRAALLSDYRELQH